MVGFASAGPGDPDDGRDPDISPGLLESWGVGAFAGIQSGVVATVTFEFLPGSPGFGSLIQLGPTVGIAGPWISTTDTAIIEPEYGSVWVAPVPLPAAALFMVSALVALGGVRRRPG